MLGSVLSEAHQQFAGVNRPVWGSTSHPGGRGEALASQFPALPPGGGDGERKLLGRRRPNKGANTLRGHILFLKP